MILVDELQVYTQAPQPGAEQWFGNGKESAHLTCMGDLDELHQFARGLGLKPEWFQPSPPHPLPHYDLVPAKHARALQRGAVLVCCKPTLFLARKGMPHQLLTLTYRVHEGRQIAKLSCAACTARLTYDWTKTYMMRVEL